MINVPSPSLGCFFEAERCKRNHLIMKFFNYFAVWGNPGHANKSPHEILAPGKCLEIANGKRYPERPGSKLETVYGGKRHVEFFSF